MVPVFCIYDVLTSWIALQFQGETAPLGLVSASTVWVLCTLHIFPVQTSHSWVLSLTTDNLLYPAFKHLISIPSAFGHPRPRTTQLEAIPTSYKPPRFMQDQPGYSSFLTLLCLAYRNPAKALSQLFSYCCPGIVPVWQGMHPYLANVSNILLFQWPWLL